MIKITATLVLLLAAGLCEATEIPNVENFPKLQALTDGEMEWEATETNVEALHPDAMLALNGKKVFFKFEHSPKVQAQLASKIVAAGGELVTQPQDAEIALESSGIFFAWRPYRNRYAVNDMGTIVEKGMKDSDIGSKPSRTNFLLQPGGAALTMVQATAMANIADFIGEATGVSGWFNTAVAGDPDGFCISHCDLWKFQQIAILVIREIEADGKLGKVFTAYRAKGMDEKSNKMMANELINGVLSAAFTPQSNTEN